MKDKILIVNDDKNEIFELRDFLNKNYVVDYCTNVVNMYEILEQNKDMYVIIILDLVMPNTNIIDTIKYINSKYRVGIIVTSAKASKELTKILFDLNVFDIIVKPFDNNVILNRVSHCISIKRNEFKLFNALCKTMYDNHKDKNIMINILASVIETINGESKEHIININNITRILVEYINNKYNYYTQEEIDYIVLASSLHDIGKIFTPSEILNKVGRLNDNEYSIMKEHTLNGASLIENIIKYYDEPLLKITRDICLYHHERFDGKGYPLGLIGDEIPLHAQIVALADCYDALTSERCYKKAYSSSVAINMIKKGDCGCFNAFLVETLITCQDDIKNSINAKIIANKRMIDIQDSLNSII